MLLWSAYAYAAGITCFVVPYFAYGSGVVNVEGKSDDLWSTGHLSYFAIVICFHTVILV
jgi:hypothetical protein